ncbi:hypothetical protein BS297_07000 [Rhodococcus erythropolis]|uniref:Uncharacterized protein n=1 Tax=Rhodococcus erythropolis TaxID=1833 RepID=A0A5N5E7F9_RHOER|nr:hypothetical protein BS297_07000 [Rhodococcus erythropolis]
MAGKIIESLLRVDPITIDEMGSRRSMTPAPGLRCHRAAFVGDRFALAVGAVGSVLSEHTTAASMLDGSLRRATIVVIDGESYRTKDAQHRKGRP